jgi:hypothetical protein
MVIIKATCPACGEVDLTGDQVKLRIGADAEPDSYAFECPSCLQQIRKPADPRVVQLLLSGGVTLEDAASDLVSVRRQHPASPRRAPAITYDDLLEWHSELEAGVLENFLRSAAA